MRPAASSYQTGTRRSEYGQAIQERFISKKVENLAHAVSLHFLAYNFAQPDGALKNPYPRTPAMAAGVADHVWSLVEIAALLD